MNNPLFHAYGTSISVLVALTHGSALILPAPHFTPELSLRAIRDENANVVYGTPTSKYLKFFIFLILNCLVEQRIRTKLVFYCLYHQCLLI